MYSTREVEFDQLDESNRKLYERLQGREADNRELRGNLAALRARVQGQTGTDDEILSQIADKEKELIIKALDKYNGKRKIAAKELGISERTLYRKLKEYDLQ